MRDSDSDMADSEEFMRAMSLLQRDPISSRLPEEKKFSLVSQSLGIGRDAAYKLRRERGSNDLFKLSADMGLGIEYDYNDRKSDKWHLCSRYSASPPRIIILEPLLRLYKEAASEIEMETNTLLPDICRLSIAHQMFHHLERLWVGFVSRMYMVNSLNLGLIRIQKAVGSLSEVAAAGFTRELLQLDESPIYVEDLLRQRVRS